MRRSSSILFGIYSFAMKFRVFQILCLVLLEGSLVGEGVPWGVPVPIKKLQLNLSWMLCWSIAEGRGRTEERGVRVFQFAYSSYVTPSKCVTQVEALDFCFFWKIKWRLESLWLKACKKLKSINSGCKKSKSIKSLLVILTGAEECL